MPTRGPAEEALESGDAPVTSTLSLVFWAFVAAILLAQIFGLAIYFRHHGIVYNILHGFPSTFVLAGKLVVIAAALRIAMYFRLRLPKPSYRENGWHVPVLIAIELAVIISVFALTTYAYSWPKVMIPALNPRIWDELLIKIDSVLCFGINPNEFLLTVFEGAPPLISRMLDRFYHSFVIVQGAITAWFVTEPQMRRRIVFGASVTTLWILGTWSYVIMPALGPVYVFEDFLPRIATVFSDTAASQVALLQNYQMVQRIIVGEPGMIAPHLGIAAMPSLHVAVQFFLFLWARFIGSRLSLLLLATTTLTLFGSIATGWHYLIDGLAGLVLAIATFGIGVLLTRLLDTLEISRQKKSLTAGKSTSTRPNISQNSPDDEAP